jgi:hypothetical protein
MIVLKPFILFAFWNGTCPFFSTLFKFSKHLRESTSGWLTDEPHGNDGVGLGSSMFISLVKSFSTLSDIIAAAFQS